MTSYIFKSGDGAYPNSNIFVTPFRQDAHLNAQRRQFNNKLSSCRQVVERAIGLLKGRGWHLKCIYCDSADLVVDYIAAACVLHNFCIMNNDIIEVCSEPEEDPNIGHQVLRPVAGGVNATRRALLLQEMFDLTMLHQTAVFLSLDLQFYRGKCVMTGESDEPSFRLCFYILHDLQENNTLLGYYAEGISTRGVYHLSEFFSLYN